MQESKMISKDISSGGGAHKTLSAFADKLLKECKIKVNIDYMIEPSYMMELPYIPIVYI